MRVLQGSPNDGSLVQAAVEQKFDAIAWNIDLGVPPDDSPLPSHGYLRVSYDPEAARHHPHWQHAPQHHEWLTRFQDWNGGHPALVEGYIGLNTVPAAAHAFERIIRLVNSRPKIETIWIADIQGPPMGCGCGNPSCRSWDNAPGEKVAPTTYEHPEVLFPWVFFQRLQEALPDRRLIPILCPECERGVSIDGVPDPDGPDGSNLCQGVACMSPCAQVFWPRLMDTFGDLPMVGLLLRVDALEKNHPVFGAPRKWAERAHRSYSERREWVPVVELPEANAFDSVLVMTELEPLVRPCPLPKGYVPTVPSIQCGYCPPEP